jgi:hypothetical protein
MSGYSNGGLDTCITPQQYYNETYGGNKWHKNTLKTIYLSAVD